MALPIAEFAAGKSAPGHIAGEKFVQTQALVAPETHRASSVIGDDVGAPIVEHFRAKDEGVIAAQVRQVLDDVQYAVGPNVFGPTGVTKQHRVACQTDQWESAEGGVAGRANIRLAGENAVRGSIKIVAGRILRVVVGQDGL